MLACLQCASRFQDGGEGLKSFTGIFDLLRNTDKRNLVLSNCTCINKQQIEMESSVERSGIVKDQKTGLAVTQINRFIKDRSIISLKFKDKSKGDNFALMVLVDSNFLFHFHFYHP